MKRIHKSTRWISLILTITVIVGMIAGIKIEKEYDAIIAGFLKKFSENRFVTSAFYGIRPAAVAMVLSALLLLSRTVFLNLPQNIADFSLAGSVNWIAVGLGLLVFLLTTRLKKVHPIAFIALGAVAGILFGL